MKFLQGYKTYLTALASITGALASLATGALELGDAVQVIITAILAVTLRHGNKTESQAQVTETK